MSVRIKRYSAVGPVDQGYGSFIDDTTQVQRETTVDGQTFHWARNEVRNFMDDGVGIAHAAFGTTINDIQDTLPFGSSRS